MDNDDRIIELVKGQATLDSDIKTLYKLNSTTNKTMEKNQNALMSEIGAIRAEQKIDKSEREKFSGILTKGKTVGITVMIIIILMANGAVSALQLILKKFI